MLRIRKDSRTEAKYHGFRSMERKIVMRLFVHNILVSTVVELFLFWYRNTYAGYFPVDTRSVSCR